MLIKNVTIIGSGTLGTRIGLQAALSGYQTTFYDISDQILDGSRKVADKIMQQLIKINLKTEQSKAEAFQRIRHTSNLTQALQECDFISESVTEDLSIKEKVWKEISELAPSKTIFTTNTSFLLPSQLAGVSGRPDKFCAFHFHDVFYSRIVDIMPHPGTDSEMIPILQAMGRSLNQVPVVMKKESPGYIFNFMLLAVLGSAGKLKTGDIASVEDIDRSWMVNFHAPMGPFGILDNIGLDTAWHVVKERNDSASQNFAKLLREFIDAGKLGEKTGEGFYKHPNPTYRNPEFLKS